MQKSRIFFMWREDCNLLGPLFWLFLYLPNIGIADFVAEPLASYLDINNYGNFDNLYTQYQFLALIE